jgi:hypothetical protein
LKADLVAVGDGLGEGIEAGVIEGVEFVEELFAFLGGHVVGVAGGERFVGVGLGVPEAVGVPLAHGAEDGALVETAAAIGGAPVDAGEAERFTDVEHVVDAFGAPRDVGFEHPVGVCERGGEDEFIGGCGCCGLSEEGRGGGGAAGGEERAEEGATVHLRFQ